MVSTSVTTVPTTDQGWLNAMYNLLGEIDDIRVSEHAQRNAYYYGFFPKSSYGYMGLGYVGYPAAVGADWAYKNLGLQTLVHEVGHNTGLLHAPCGGPSNPDAQLSLRQCNPRGRQPLHLGLQRINQHLHRPHQQRAA